MTYPAAIPMQPVGPTAFTGAVPPGVSQYAGQQEEYASRVAHARMQAQNEIAQARQTYQAQLAQRQIELHAQLQAAQQQFEQWRAGQLDALAAEEQQLQAAQQRFAHPNTTAAVPLPSPGSPGYAPTPDFGSRFGAPARGGPAAPAMPVAMSQGGQIPDGQGEQHKMRYGQNQGRLPRFAQGGDMGPGGGINTIHGDSITGWYVTTPGGQTYGPYPNYADATVASGVIAAGRAAPPATGVPPTEEGLPPSTTYGGSAYPTRPAAPAPQTGAPPPAPPPAPAAPPRPAPAAAAPAAPAPTTAASAPVPAVPPVLSQSGSAVSRPARPGLAPAATVNADGSRSAPRTGTSPTPGHVILPPNDTPGRIGAIHVQQLPDGRTIYTVVDGRGGATFDSLEGAQAYQTNLLNRGTGEQAPATPTQQTNSTVAQGVPGIPDGSYYLNGVLWGPHQQAAMDAVLAQRAQENAAAEQARQAAYAAERARNEEAAAAQTRTLSYHSGDWNNFFAANPGAAAAMRGWGGGSGVPPVPSGLGSTPTQTATSSSIPPAQAKERPPWEMRYAAGGQTPDMPPAPPAALMDMMGSGAPDSDAGMESAEPNAITGEGSGPGGFNMEVVLTPEGLEAAKAVGGIKIVDKPTASSLTPGSIIIPTKENSNLRDVLSRNIPALDGEPAVKDDGEWTPESMARGGKVGAKGKRMPPPVPAKLKQKSG